MPFIKAAISEAKEAELVPEGKYKLEILSHKCYDEDKNQVDDEGDPARIQTVIRIDSDDHPNADLIYHTIWLKGKEEFAAQTVRNLKRFLVAFDIPFEADGFNPEDLDGATGECPVYQNEGADKIMRHALRLPRVSEEAEERPARGARGKPVAEPKRAAGGRRR